MALTKAEQDSFMADIARGARNVAHAKKASADTGITEQQARAIVSHYQAMEHATDPTDKLLIGGLAVRAGIAERPDELLPKFQKIYEALCEVEATHASDLYRRIKGIGG